MATQLSKSQLIEKIATSTELSKRDVKNVMDTLVDVGHKELKKSGLFLVPGFAKLDRVALGMASGIVTGVMLLAATLALVVRGGPVVGPNLALLGQYLPGYRVTPGGAFLCKVLQGGTETTLLAALKRNFASVKHVKPSASRADSAELYLLATGFRGRTLP